MSDSNTTQIAPQFSLRPATESDLASCHAIYRHYALNTTIAFLLNDPPLKYISDRYHATLAHGLPYLVAVSVDSSSSTFTSTSTNPSSQPHEPTSLANVSPPPPSSTVTSITSTATTAASASAVSNDAESTENETILGFAHASPFSASKAGYAPSVEITLFCAPDHLGKGVGSALLTHLLEDLKTCPNVQWEEGHEDKKVRDVPVRNVFAIVSQDVERRPGAGEARGEEIVDWYCTRFGFRVAGRLEGVGWKFGREVDVFYLQKRLV